MNGQRPRTPFVSRSRDFAASLIEQRRAWIVFLGACKAQGHLAVGERWPFEDDARSFANLIARLTAFPVRISSAVEVAEATRRIGRALADSRNPIDRAELGALLLSSAAFLERMLSEDVQAAAALSRRISGEADDD
jgi:hypothetical protein